MAISGFEGFEKRLELEFSGDEPLGLRRLSLEALEQVLDAVQCSIVSAVGNRYFDAYVLSESSLFLYPNRIIIKTCGTTQLLKSIPSLLVHTLDLGLHLRWCKYTRGSFIFPKAQPFPHSSFREEVIYLEGSLPGSLCYRKACVLPSKASHSWHVYCASAHHDAMVVNGPASPKGLITLEVCMTQLDRALASRFFRFPGDNSTSHDAAMVMTVATGIADINPQALICDYAFEPCGYSMNGLDLDRYSTIHVTPEDGYSYASFECVLGHNDEISEVLDKVAQVFRPATISVSACTTVGDGLSEDGIWTAVADGLKPQGLGCRCRMMEEFPGVGTVTYQTFTARRK